ncbi:MAG: acyl-ACP--UDP-N-acetylglucosamine O-acyltransferase [Candidatus Eutrophobiaceae bacterium]
MIHSTAIIDPNAQLLDDVQVGPWSVIGAGVQIGAGCIIDHHVSIQGPTRIGSNNHIHPFASIGGDPQDKKYRSGTESELIIGDGNTIREYVTINRGTPGGGGRTALGNDNWIMAGTHIAHDCKVGSHTVFANQVLLAGHVEVQDYAILGAVTGVHQFCCIGRHSFAAAYSAISMDVPPFTLVEGNRATSCGLNRVGLKRHGFSPEVISALKKAYRIVYQSGTGQEEAIKRLRTEGLIDIAEVKEFCDFIAVSTRGTPRHITR